MATLAKGRKAVACSHPLDPKSTQSLPKAADSQCRRRRRRRSLLPAVTGRASTTRCRVQPVGVTRRVTLQGVGVATRRSASQGSRSARTAHLPGQLPSRSAYLPACLPSSVPPVLPNLPPDIVLLDCQPQKMDVERNWHVTRRTDVSNDAENDQPANGDDGLTSTDYYLQALGLAIKTAPFLQCICWSVPMEGATQLSVPIKIRYLSPLSILNSRCMGRNQSVGPADGKHSRSVFWGGGLHGRTPGVRYWSPCY